MAAHLCSEIMEIIRDMDEHTTSSNLLSYQWRRWIAENKMLKIDDAAIIDILLRNGIERQLAVEEVQAVTAHPYFQAGTEMTLRLRKLEWLLSVYRDLAALSSQFGNIERRRNLSQQDFLENYYVVNRPVILLDLMQTWKALSLWNLEYLKATYGHETVEIMAEREPDPKYEINSDKHKRTVLFSEYVDMVIRVGKSNDFYLEANNHFLEKEGMKGLYNDIEIFPEFLDCNKRSGNVFFWFGPAGTVTPLHHDTMNIFLAQVYGRKQITLLSPDQAPLVYNYVGVYSEVDCEKPDYDTYPLFREVKKIEVILEPGEVLFLPVGWWHHVRSLDISISVSFINFLFANDYHWNYPEIRR
jgi:hypothetical protein